MASPRSLNDIGPGVMIEPRSGSWTVRFRLPSAIQERYNLPRIPRLRTENLPSGPLDEKRLSTALRREANRIGAELDLRISGHDTLGPGESLAHWLGLVETNRVRANSKRRVPKTKTWQHLVQVYIETFKAESVARTYNRDDAVRRLERIRALDFCQDHFPPDMTPDEWDEFLDSLLRETPDPERGSTTRAVLEAARSLIENNKGTTVREITKTVARQVKWQSVEKHIRILVERGWLTKTMQIRHDGLKRKLRVLTPGPRFTDSFTVVGPTSSARTTNKMRALLRRIYDHGIALRLFRENPILLTVKCTAGRRLSTKPC